MKKSKKKFVLVGLVLLAVTGLLVLAGCDTTLEPESPQMEQAVNTDSTGGDSNNEDNIGTGDNTGDGGNTGDDSNNESTGSGDNTGGTVNGDNPSTGGDASDGGNTSGDGSGNDNTGGDENDGNIDGGVAEEEVNPNIDATAMNTDELNAAVTRALAAGETDIRIKLAEDADATMFSAITAALATDGIEEGSIDLTISGAKTVPDYGFFDNDNYFANDEKNIAGDKLKSLTLTDVETIGEWAFSACTNLEAVNMPKVVTIGEYAFNEWKKGTKLTSLDLPNATTIGESAFAYSSLLTSVNLPKVVTIGTVAFAGCDLRSLYLPEATTIGGGAFENNYNLVSCSAPKATTIGYYPWGSNGTSKLERLELTAVGDFTLGNNLFAYTPTGQINLVLNEDKASQVKLNDDGTATWKTTNSNGGKLEYTFKSITTQE